MAGKRKGKREKQHNDNIVLYTQEEKRKVSNDRTYGQRKITPTTDGLPRQHTETKEKLKTRNELGKLLKIATKKLNPQNILKKKANSLTKCSFSKKAIFRHKFSHSANVSQL